jgi:hypothetical protein
MFSRSPYRSSVLNAVAFPHHVLYHNTQLSFPWSYLAGCLICNEPPARSLDDHCEHLPRFGFRSEPRNIEMPSMIEMPRNIKVPGIQSMATTNRNAGSEAKLCSWKVPHWPGLLIPRKIASGTWPRTDFIWKWGRVPGGAKYCQYWDAEHHWGAEDPINGFYPALPCIARRRIGLVFVGVCVGR